MNYLGPKYYVNGYLTCHTACIPNFLSYHSAISATILDLDVFHGVGTLILAAYLFF